MAWLRCLPASLLMGSKLMQKKLILLHAISDIVVLEIYNLYFVVPVFASITFIASLLSLYNIVLARRNPRCSHILCVQIIIVPHSAAATNSEKLVSSKKIVVCGLYTRKYILPFTVQIQSKTGYRLYHFLDSHPRMPQSVRLSERRISTCLTISTP